jgi:hypothetical protein
MPELSDLDWTPAQLRVYFDRILSERDQRYAAERKADKEAVRVAYENSNRALETSTEEAKERLAAHNGLLDKMEKQADQFLPRELFDQALQESRGRQEAQAARTGTLEGRVGAVESREAGSREGAGTTLQYLVALIAVVAIVANFLH